MHLPLFKRGPLCTCPPKYNINTYTGRCRHSCIYCYAVKFPAFRGELKPRLSLIQNLDEIARIRPKMTIMLSDATDPYQPAERKYYITRRVVAKLGESGFPLLIVTKSHLVARDTDILKRSMCVVSLTVTTLDRRKSLAIEPNAPPPRLRLRALSFLSSTGVPTAARIDPIIPGLNDSPEELRKLVIRLHEAGVQHVTASTLKPVRGFFKNVRQIPWLYERLAREYQGAVKVAGYSYLPEDRRRELLAPVREAAEEMGLTFAVCREGFNWNTATCDGSHLATGVSQLML